MWLQSIEFARYSEERPLTGYVKFNGEEGNIQCTLSKEEIDDLMKVLGQVLIKHAQSSAKRLEQASMQTMGLLIEAKHNE